jgi:putative (di)nucleoside polyphosphate hydrolase
MPLASSSGRASRRTSCGVLVTDGARLLLGHATRSPRWDIPKGLREADETLRETAARELEEETGLIVAESVLRDLGVHAYLPAKDLALFAWRPPCLPDPGGLSCRTTFVARNGALLPEFDRFALFSWSDALSIVGRNLARVLTDIRPLLPD